MTDALPALALSVRQPWAWAIIHAGKDIENRTATAIKLGRMRAAVGTRIAIHASKGMSRQEYELARNAMALLNGVAHAPPPAALARGGIIGTVLVVGIVKTSPSPWFEGPYGLELREPSATPFIGADGELGIFKWMANGRAPMPPAQWMRATVPQLGTASLFGER